MRINFVISRLKRPIKSFCFVNRKSINTSNHFDLIKIHPLVSAALSKRSPVVALESTIISHGMPYPQNQ